MTTETPCVVVGYDGSATARAAVELLHIAQRPVTVVPERSLRHEAADVATAPLTFAGSGAPR
jgi:hypothetical protein